MRLSSSTDLGQLAEMMGTPATRDEARRLLNHLLALGHKDTDEILEDDWLALLNTALTRAQE